MEAHRKALLSYLISLGVLCLAALCIIFIPSPLPQPEKIPGSVIGQRTFDLLGEEGKYLAADIEKAVVQIRSGTLSPVEEDAILDSSEDLMQSDVHRLVEHSQTIGYMERIIERLRQAPTVRNDPHQQHIRLYDDRFIPSANWQVVAQGKYPFSLADGTTYYGAKLFIESRSEAEVAGILAHEISHGILRHVATIRLYRKNISRLQEQAEKISSSYAFVVLAYATAFVFADYELNAEKEADRLAQVILREAGYDDIEFIEILRRSPPEVARVKRAEEDSRARRMSGAQREKFIVATPKEFHAIQKSLKAFLEQPTK